MFSIFDRNEMQIKWGKNYPSDLIILRPENLRKLNEKLCNAKPSFKLSATFIHSKSLMKGNIVVGLMAKGWLKKHCGTTNFMCGKSSRETGDGNKTLSFLAFPVGTKSFHSGNASQMLIAWNAPDHLETSHVKRFGAFTVNIMTWNVISDFALSQQLDLNSMLCQSGSSPSPALSISLPLYRHHHLANTFNKRTL